MDLYGQTLGRNMTQQFSNDLKNNVTMMEVMEVTVGLSTQTCTHQS